MNNKDQSTPRPWILDDYYIHPKDKKISIAEVYNRSNYAPAGGYEIPSVEEGKANACLIVKCVNCHDELVEACKSAMRYDEAIQYQANKGKSWVESDTLDILYEDWMNKVKQALSKAQGGDL